MEKKTFHTWRRKGLPVLAYLSDSTAGSLLPCSFNVKYSECFTAVSISLQFSFFVDGFDDKQLFTLIYGADNLVATLWHGADSFIPPERLNEISNQSRCEWKTLSLALETICTIQCPACRIPISPHKSTPPTFNNCFVQLARAKETKIVLNFSTFRPEERATLDKIIGSLGKSAACPIGVGGKHVQYTTGLAFECPEEPPPSYNDVSKNHSMQRATRRHRQASCSQTPERPSSRPAVPSSTSISAPSLTKTTRASSPSRASLSSREALHSAVYIPGSTPSPTVANTIESLPLPLVQSPTVSSTRHSSAPSQSRDSARKSISDANTAKRGSATPCVSNSSSPANPSDRLPGLLSRRSSINQPFRSSGCAPWNYTIKMQAASSIYNAFTRKQGAEIVGEMQEMIEDAVADVQNLHSEFEETINDTVEEGKADLKRTFEEYAKDIETLACDRLHDFQDDVEEIRDGKLADCSVECHWRIDTARELVLERSQITKAKKRLRKREAKLREQQQRLKQESDILHKRKKKLRQKEQIFAQKELKVDKMEDEYKKNRAEQTSETEDE